MLKLNLEAEGYEAVVASDGRMALDLLRQHRPGLMLLDVMMPVMDGWQVLEELRTLPPEERPGVVMVSALSSASDLARAEGLGVDAIVSKPFEMDHLLEVVRGMASGRAGPSGPV